MARLNHYMDSWGMLSVMLHGLSEMADYYMVLTRCVLVCFVYICRRKPYTMKLLASIGNTIMYLLCVIVAWLGLTPLAAYAVPRLPEPEFDWKNVQVDGRKTAVFSLYRDSRGLMWVGTNKGLFFYDGVTVHPVGESELKGLHIHAIVEQGPLLYLGTNNGLMTFDLGTGRVTPAHKQMPKEIRCMLAYDGTLWVGSLYGIYRLSLADGTVTDHSAGLPHKSVYSILRDSRGILYAGTYNGLARWDSRGHRFRPVRAEVGMPAHKNLFVNAMVESADGRSIFIGTEGALYEYTPANDGWSRVSVMDNNVVKSLAEGADGHLLVGTDNGVFDLTRDSLRHFRHDSRQELSLSDNEIWCIYADDSQNIWAGHERGLSIASNSNHIKTVKLSALANSGESNEIHAIFRDSRNDLWLGGANGVIRLTEGSAPRWYRHTDLPGALSHNCIRAIDEDSDHNIWLSTDAGLNRYDRRADRFDVFCVVDSLGEHNSNWVYALEEDDSRLWVGSFLGGLHGVDKTKFLGAGGTVVSDVSLNAESPDRAALPNDQINNVVTDAEGNLWILLFRDNTLIRYTPADGSVRKFDLFALTGAYHEHICADSRGRVWCAFSGGVIVFDSSGNHRVVRLPHTNSDENVFAIGKVGNGVWLSTQSNVWRIDGDTYETTILPVAARGFTAIYEDSITGNVLLGGIDEIVEVDSRGIGDSTDYRNIRLILHDRGRGDFDLSDPRGGAKGLTIPYGGSVTLVVSTLDYSPDSPRRYMYKLAESASDTTGGWVIMPEGVNTLTLSDLKMGRYRVLVKAVGSPAEPVSVPLRVRPPWWLSWWAVCLYVFLAAVVLCWVIWYTRRRNLRVFREQERQTALENVEKKLTFLSSISHDLKTPLSMIMGPVSLMKERARDPEIRKNLETVYDNAVRLNNMIHRTLELQNLDEAAENLLILSTFDVVEFCRGVFDLFRENNPQKKFVFHSSCPSLFIEADAVKFESVITNLLSNACKYSADDATISCGISRAGDNVEIAVTDDGVGISAVDQPLVFQRMFRAPATAKLREGTGLGLYLIKKYLELMHGNISLYSREGEGASFVVTLPAKDTDIPEARRDSAGDEGGLPKILVVEDNLQISRFITGMLEDQYTCFTAENGRSGLAIAASIIPDLIIVDEMMPIMNGLEMVRRLKQQPRLASVPVIMLTAKSDNRTENESIKLGIDVFMAKPFDPASLSGRISQLLKGRSEIKEKVRIQAITEAESRPIEAESVNEKALARIASVIEENVADPDLNVSRLCELCGMPEKQLYRLIKKYMGTAPLDYIRRVRLQKAAVLLAQQRFTVSEISYMVGFKTPSYFARCFQNQYGVKPSQYRSDDDTVGHK